MTEILQKSENVVKNVANENSQDLTSQWKKGELPSGWYYVRLIRGEYRIDLYINGKKEWIDCPDNIIDAVVREVPSYEVYKDLIDGRKLLREYIKDTTNENAQLKETVEALESELKEVCDVLIRKCPEMKEWVMLNWKNLYEVEK